MSLSKTLYQLLSNGSTQEDPTQNEKLLAGTLRIKTSKQTNKSFSGLYIVFGLDLASVCMTECP